MLNLSLSHWLKNWRKKSSWFCNFCIPTSLFQPLRLRLERWEYFILFFLMPCPMSITESKVVPKDGVCCPNFQWRFWRYIEQQDPKYFCSVLTLKMIDIPLRPQLCHTWAFKYCFIEVLLTTIIFDTEQVKVWTNSRIYSGTVSAISLIKVSKS